MTTSSDRVWPAWSVETAPADLARYVVPEVVRQHAQLPGPSGALVLARVRAVWDGLRECGIGYAHEPSGSSADGQWIRPPAELLVAPRNGTCLDLAVLLAGALDHAGLRTAVVVLDAVAPGRPGHALVAVLLGESWPGDQGGDGVWLRPPPGFHDAVQTGPDAPPNDVLVLDPDGIAHSLAERDADGTDVDLALAAATGDAHLTSGRYVWRLGVVVDRADPFRPAPLPQVLPLRDPYREPATAESALRLLRAEYRITPFQGRDELTVLSGLCEETVAGRRTGVAVVTGRGGAGKTRLGLELVHRMAQAGWYAGVLREQARPGPTLDWLAEVTAPLLVMIDYADARASSVIEVLRVVATRPRPAVVVLTARAREGEWLTRITDAMETDAHPYRLETVDLPDVHPRAQDVFAGTHQALTTAPLPLQGGRPRQLPTPSKGTRWTTLDLVLLGWLTAQGEAQLPVTPADLYDQVLRHERRYWNSTFESGTGTPLRYADLLGEAAACLTLLTPTPAAAARTLTAVTRLADAEDLREQVARTLVTCLDPGPGENVAIRPDPIGDHHLLTTLDRRPDLLERCLVVGSALGADEIAEGTLNALTVLTRAGRGQEAAAAAHLEALLRTEPGRWPLAAAVATSLGGVARTVLEDLAAAPDSPLPLDDVSAGLPFGAVGLWRLALVVDERRLRQARAGRDRPADLADLVFLVSRRRRDAGDRAGAVAAAEEAAGLFRELARLDPGEYTTSLADVLNDLSVHRADVGDRAGGREAGEEAVTVYRQLAATDPDTFVPDLAAALNNLSISRTATGARRDALAAAVEAVALYRELVTIDPDTHTAGLAMALSNLGNCRADLEDRAGALEAVAEAVRLRRRLAAGDGTPADGVRAEAGLPDVDDASNRLADALNNLSGRRSDVGDHNGALAAIEEATGLYRALVAVNEAVYAPDLAMALNNLAVCRSLAGDHPGALAAAEEATDLHRELAAAHPAAFSPDLAMALNTLANRRSENGETRGALDAATESVTRYRLLAEADPAAFAPDLGAALNNLSGSRSAVGDRRGALSAAEESVQLFRGLAGTDPDAFTVDLARALNTLAIRRSEAGDRAGALEATAEATALRRTLAAADPASYTRELAVSLSNLANRLSEAGRLRESADAGAEAVRVYQQLEATNRAGVAGDLAAVISNLSVQLFDLGDREGALRCGQQATDRYRELAAANPLAWSSGLAASLNNQAAQLADVGDLERARAAAEEAVTIYRRLTECERMTFLPDLAMALNNLARCRSEQDDPTGALTAGEESVSLYREAAGHPPDAAGSDRLARALNTLSVLRSDDGDHHAALAAAEEAVRLFRAVMPSHPAAVGLELSRALNNVSLQRTVLGDPAGALAAVEDATRLLRELAQDAPEAFLPDLAGTLLNLASARSAAGDLPAAVVAGRQATDLARRSAVADPASFTPDLAVASNALADLLTRTSMPGRSSGRPEAEVRAVWSSSARVLPEGSYQAEVWAAAAEWYAVHDAAPQAVECLRWAARQADPQDTPIPAYVVGRARQRIREAAAALCPTPADLPVWVAGDLPGPDLDLVAAWRTASSWREAQDVLQDHAAVLTGPTAAQTLDIQLALHPADEPLRELRDLVRRIQADGHARVLAARSHQHALEELVGDWFSQANWSDSIAYVQAHRHELNSAEVEQILARSDDPMTRRHAAVLALIRQMPSQRVYDLVSDVGAAMDQALEAIDRGDLGQLRSIADANPDVLRVAGAGFAAHALLLAADGDVEHAVQVMRAGARAASTVQRRARLVNLRRFADSGGGPVPALDALIGQLQSPVHGAQEGEP